LAALGGGGLGLHSGTIVAMDVCLSKPLVATAGADRTVRLWNHARRTCDLRWRAVEEILALALHPTGFQLLVAFKERVRLYSVLMGDLRQLRELPLAKCRELQYAHGGHLFAAAVGISVQVFNALTLAPLFKVSWLGCAPAPAPAPAPAASTPPHASPPPH